MRPFPWLSELDGCVAIARSSREPTWFASVHAQASPVPPEILELHPWDEAPLCNPWRKVWQMDLIPFELHRLFAGQTFVWGGDLNSAVRMDTSPGSAVGTVASARSGSTSSSTSRPLTTTRAVEADFEALRTPKGKRVPRSVRSGQARTALCALVQARCADAKGR